MNTTPCEHCGHEIQMGEHPFCPHGFSLGEGVQMRPDSIPGGMVIENLGPTPQTFYSRSEYQRALDKAGVVNVVKHQPPPGTDKSAQTVRWV